MKERLLFCVVAWLLMMSVALAENWYCPNCGRSCTDNFCARCGTARPADLGGGGLSDQEVGGSGIVDEYVGGYPQTSLPYTPPYTTYSTDGVWMTANRTLATRSGPGTDYSEPGSFGVESFQYKVLSRNDIWVQVELSYRGMQFRAYTGIRRFNYTPYDMNSIPVEQVQYTGMVNRLCIVQSGPGEQYTYLHQDTLDRDTVMYLSYGTGVTVYAAENGYVQIDFNQNGCQYRGWVPEYAVTRGY